MKQQRKPFKAEKTVWVLLSVLLSVLFLSLPFAVPAAEPAQKTKPKSLSEEERLKIIQHMRENDDSLYGSYGSATMSRQGEEEPMEGSSDENNSGEPAEEDKDKKEEEGIPLEVKVYARGCSPDSDYFLTDCKPSSITITGNVKDQHNKPVAGATVVLKEKSKETSTDKSGNYTIKASHSGKEPYSATVNFKLTRKLTGLRARLNVGTIITANGKTAEVTLDVSHDAGPLKNMQVDVSDTYGYQKDDKIIEYVWSRNSNSARRSTDENGRVKFTLNCPDSVKEFDGTVDSKSAFPISGFLKVRVPAADSETVLKYTINNPFPRITDFSLPRYIEAGQWQIDPSKITVKDNDSSEFKITLEGLGAFKEKGDGKSQGRGHPKLLYSAFPGNSFQFHYRPIMRGFDLNNQPKVLKEMAECGGKIYLSVLTNVGGDKMFAANKFKAGGSTVPGKSMYPAMGTVKSFVPLSGNAADMVMDLKRLKRIQKMKQAMAGGMDITADAANTLTSAPDTVGNIMDAASNLSNVGNLMSTTYTGQDQIKGLVKGDFTEQNIITTTDNAIALADTTMGAFNVLSANGKIYWEVVKASWEIDKVAYKISNQYYDIAEAYQDTVQEPVTVTVEDETGRKAVLQKTYNVLIWMGGS